MTVSTPQSGRPRKINDHTARSVVQTHQTICEELEEFVVLFSPLLYNAVQ